MKAMELKTREALEKARELLKEQATVSPFHRVTPLYNLACVEALLGDKLEKALEYLQEAVAAGWTDVEHIKNDADLIALQGLDAFKALLASLEADSSDDDSGVEIHVNFGGVSKEERKKLKQEWRQKRVQERAEKVQARAEKVQAVAEQAKAENSPNAQKLENRAEKLQAKAEKLQAAAEKIQSKIESKEEKKAEPEVKTEEKKPEPTPVPAPVAVAAPVAAPVPTPAPAQLSGSSTVDEFQAKLKTLEEMGFADRRRNITALVLARGDLVNAVQSLLSGQ
jgi:DNA repair exonuclease SbcCD ATPase subunit